MEDDKNKISHYQIAANRQRQKEAKDAKYRDKSKKRLSNIITTKIILVFFGGMEKTRTV